MKVTVKDWRQFQHYKDRRPPWIKLHRALLDDRAYLSLPVQSLAVAPLLWLLASESDDGEIDVSPENLEFRLRLPRPVLKSGVDGLLSAGLLIASTSLALCEQTAPESPLLSSEPLLCTSPLPEDFLRFWSAYGKKGNRKKALEEWKKLKPLPELVEVIATRATSYRQSVEHPKYQKDAERWLKYEGWNDEIVTAKNGSMPGGRREATASDFEGMPNVGKI